MAGTYTNSASGAGMRYGMHAYIKVVVTDTSNTVCRVRVECWAVSDGGYSGFIDGRCSAYPGGSYGSWTGHDQDVTAGGSTRLNYAEFNVDRGSSNKTVTYWAQIRGTSTSSSNYYYGCSESVSVNATIPKISTEKPNAPTDCSATYVSDSSVSVSWTNGSTTSTKPRTATLVERSTDGGAWVQIASASSSASNYTDNGTSSNHSYAYRVCATNGAGKSAYSTAQSVIYTTPAAPSSVTLEKTSATTVQVGIEGAPPYATGYNVERTQDGGSTWANIGTGVSMPIQDTVAGGTVKYRVAAVNGSLVSPWAVSEAIVTICPPLAPTITQQPSNPTVAGSGAVITWTPNHPDGTTQTAAQVKFDGTTVDLGADARSYTQIVQVGSHTVQVRTKGLDASWGAWSNVISFNAYNPPSVAIDSPSVDGETVTALPLYIEWGVTDTTGVSTQRVAVTDSNGTQIYNRTQGANVRSLALTDSDIALRNGGSYTIRLRVMGGSGLVTEQTRIFDVAWLAPAAPVLQLTEGEGRSATIDVMDTHYSESGSTIAVDGSAIADSFTVYGKSTQDGTPTPSAPVDIESVQPKNILNPTARTVTSSGVTYTCSEDGLVTLSGTATATNWFTLKQASTFPAGTYTASKTGGTSTIKFGNNTAQEVTKTYSAAWSSSDLAVYVYQGSTYDESFYVQLERGSTATEYVPYGAIGLCLASRNMLSPEPRTATDKGVTYTCASDGTITLQGTCTGYTYFILKRSSITFPAGTYTFSKTGGESNVFWIGKGTERDSITQTTTGDTDIRNLYISVEAGKVYNETFNVQLERGSTATEYVPYEVDTYPIDLQGNALRSLPDGTEDTLEVDGEGNVTLTKRIGIKTFDGSESWGVNPNVGTGFAYTPKPTDMASGDGAASVPLMRVDRFELKLASTGGNVYASGSNLLFYRDGSSFNPSSTAEAKAWFATNPTTVIYKLATPQTISLGAVSDLPFIPDDGEMWMDGTEMEAVLRPADYAGQPPIQSVDVQRVNADGTAWTVATGLTVGATCIDPLPPLGVEVTYIATASASTGATASETYTEVIGGMEWVLNFGNAAEFPIEFRFNPEASYSLEHGGESYHFADGGAGNGLPVWYGTTNRDESGSLKFDNYLFENFDRLRELSIGHPVSWLRDPYGHRWRAHVTPSSEHSTGKMVETGLDWEAVRFREAW